MDFLVCRLSLSLVFVFLQFVLSQTLPSRLETFSSERDWQRCWSGRIVAVTAFYLFYSNLFSHSPLQKILRPFLIFLWWLAVETFPRGRRFNKTPCSESRLLLCPQWPDYKSSAWLYEDGGCPDLTSLWLYAFKTSLSWDLCFHRDLYSTRDPAGVW